MQVLQPYNMLEGFLFLPLQPELFAHIPEQVEAFGHTLLKKEEFHVTLINTKRIAAQVSVEPEEVVKAFSTFVQKNSISLVRFDDDFRYVHDVARERMSVVVRCEVAGLSELYTFLEEYFKQVLPLQPAHVTLYTLSNGLGIGINSEAEMQALPRIDMPEVTAGLK